MQSEKQAAMNPQVAVPMAIAVPHQQPSQGQPVVAMPVQSIPQCQPAVAMPVQSVAVPVTTQQQVFATPVGGMAQGQQDVAQCRRCGKSFVRGPKHIPHTSSWFRCEGCAGIKSSDIAASCIVS
jgi:hypothetical protein